MTTFSIFLMIWLGVGFVAGLFFVSGVEVDENLKRDWETSDLDLPEYPKNPKLFILSATTLGGIFFICWWLKVSYKQKRKN